MNRVSLAEPKGQAAFDYLGVRYSETARPLSVYPFQLTQYLTEQHLSKHRGGRLLDLGCGRGEFLKGFLEQGFDGVGIDRQASTLLDLSGRIQALNIESEALPFSTDSLDVIFNKSVLEHLTHISPVLNECKRVLKPGGTLLCMVPDFRSQWPHFYDDWTHVRPFTLTGLTECLMSHGYTVVSSRRFRQLPALWSRPYLSPLADLASLLPSQFKRSKWVRFSKELMLLVAAQKPPTLG
jgi:ubiquinone/menaquinone biosynthesis C-methylase UbiE